MKLGYSGGMIHEFPDHALLDDVGVDHTPVQRMEQSPLITIIADGADPLKVVQGILADIVLRILAQAFEDELGVGF